VKAVEDEALTWNAFPNPFHDQLEISGLKGDEYFILTSLFGGILMEGNNFDSFAMGELPAGVYFLSIQSAEEQQVLKLVKD